VIFPGPQRNQMIDHHLAPVFRPPHGVETEFGGQIHHQAQAERHPIRSAADQRQAGAAAGRKIRLVVDRRAKVPAIADIRPVLKGQQALIHLHGAFIGERQRAIRRKLHHQVVILHRAFRGDAAEASLGRARRGL